MINKKLKIIFFGTPDFAVPCLEAIKDDIVMVVSGPDRIERKIRKYPPVKEKALELGIPVLQPTDLEDPEFLESLRDIEADLFVVVAFKLLPRIVWKMPKYGTFNIHASLLPNYRGAAPIEWAMMNGETETGITSFWIDEHVDTGRIILQSSIQIERNEYLESVYSRLMILGAEITKRTVEEIKKYNGNPPCYEQKLTGTEKKAPKLNKGMGRIDWSLPAEDIVRKIHGFPGAWTTLGELEVLIIWKARSLGHGIPELVKPGEHIYIGDRDDVAVQTGSGEMILLEEIQVPGGKRMPARDFFNGHKNILGIK